MTDLAHIEKGYGATTSSDTTTPQNKTSSSWPRAIAALALVAVAAVGVSTKTVSTKTSWQETEAAPELVANGWTPPPHVPHTRHQWYETENNTAFLDWKCTYEGDAELFSDAFKLSSGEAMPFWTSSWWPWDNCMSLTDVETLFIPIHGADDDGNLYLSAAWDVVLQELDPVNCANDGKYYVVAPQFNDDERCAKKHSVCQQFGDGPHGMSDDGKTIKWHRGSYWMEGQESKKVKHRDKTSSYDALDQLLDYMSGDRCMPSLKRVVLLGYSGGAQFVQRYSLTSKVLQAVEDRGLSTSVFIGAPLSIAYLDDERPDLSRSERCWNEIGGCDIWPECRPDEDMNLDAWSNCSIDEPYRFMPFQDMDDAKKMPVTLGTNDTSCYSGANPHVKWWSWKYQAKIDESLTARHKPAYLLDNYFANQDYYNRRYAERHTVWLVGTHDGESVTFPGRDHCADLIQGDSHLPVTVAGYRGRAEITPSFGRHRLRGISIRRGRGVAATTRLLGRPLRINIAGTSIPGSIFSTAISNTATTFFFSPTCATFITTRSHTTTSARVSSIWTAGPKIRSTRAAPTCVVTKLHGAFKVQFLCAQQSGVRTGEWLVAAQASGLSPAT